MRIKELLWKEIEEKRAKNISDLARKIDLPSTTLREICKNGGENIKVPTLIKIAKYLNVSTDYLLGLDVKETLSSEKYNENFFEPLPHHGPGYLDDTIWIPASEIAFEESMEYFIDEFRDRMRREYVDNGGRVEWRRRKEVAKAPFTDTEMVGVDK